MLAPGQVIARIGCGLFLISANNKQKQNQIKAKTKTKRTKKTQAELNFEKASATIIITETNGLIHFNIVHDPAPTGPRETWAPPSIVADYIIKGLIGQAKAAGTDPELEAYKNSITGEIDITTRKESNGHNEAEGIDRQAGKDDNGGGVGLP